MKYLDHVSLDQQTWYNRKCNPNGYHCNRQRLFNKVTISCNQSTIRIQVYHLENHFFVEELSSLTELSRRAIYAPHSSNQLCWLLLRLARLETQRSLQQMFHGV